MNEIKGTLLLFALMFALPLLLAASYGKLRKSKVLHIRQDYVRDPRYFGNSFRRMVQAALPADAEGVLHLSRPEQCVFPEDAGALAEPAVDGLVLALNGEFRPEKPHVYNKEIYCAQDASLPPGSQFRALCGQRIALARGCQCLRWVDGNEAVTVGESCDLGLSASSGRLLTLGCRTGFQRLYAPEIRLAMAPEGPPPHSPVPVPEKRNMPVLYDLRNLSERQSDSRGHVSASLITRWNLRILEGMTVEGDISGDRGVRVMKNAVVYGNVFAGADVLLEEGARVLGNVFSQGSVRLGPGASVGQPGEIHSIIARKKIYFAGDNRVYGFVSALRGGTTGDRGDGR